MNDKKTERKNKTNQTINWPSNNEYFTIDNLIQANPHMITSSGSDITLRVKLSDAITNKKMVVAIGTKNLGKGRPKLIFSMTPVNPSILNKAKADGIMLIDECKLIPIMQIKPIENTSPIEVSPVKEITSEVV